MALLDFFASGDWIVMLGAAYVLTMLGVQLYRSRNMPDFPLLLAVIVIVFIIGPAMLVYFG